MQFSQHEACLGVLLLHPGRDANPSQGYPPAVCRRYSFIETKWSKVLCLRKQRYGGGLNAGPPDPKFEMLTTQLHTPPLCERNAKLNARIFKQQKTHTLYFSFVLIILPSPPANSKSQLDDAGSANEAPCRVNGTSEHVFTPYFFFNHFSSNASQQGLLYYKIS